MSIESIIGVVAGIFGIASGCSWVYEIYSKSKKKNTAYLLLKQIADKNQTDVQRRILLKKMNKNKLSGRIKDSYINNFELNGKGLEKLFLDICVKNEIEPTEDLCKELLDSCRPSIKKQYEEILSKSIKVKSKMLRPNIVYVSSLLKEKFPNAANELFSVLRKHDVTVKELTNTRDIWCRDYMPIQNRLGELIQFNYSPSYLKGNEKWEDSRSDVREVCAANGIEPLFSNIKIDGGNVILYGDKAILTDRIFQENPEYSKNKLIAEIEELLKAKVIIIPALKSDVTGHADGMVRFVDEDTILGNDLDSEYKYIREGINKACSENSLKYVNVPFFEQKYDKDHELNAIGIYVNYLEVNNLIVLPKFNVDGNRDNEVVELFKKVFPDRIIETIDYNEIAVEGGLLNCTTWTINE